MGRKSKQRSDEIISSTSDNLTLLKISEKADEDILNNNTETPNDEHSITCSHVKKAVDNNTVRKNIERGGGVRSLVCVPCGTSKEKSENFTDIWLCLKCGSGYCNFHSKAHYSTPRSDLHCLFANIDNWTIWCHCCDRSVSSQKYSSIKEVINQIRKISSSKKVMKIEHNNSEVKAESDGEDDATMETSTSEIAQHVLKTPSVKMHMVQTPPKGLTNLGNTCFFNSVLQCLAQTPFLLEDLLAISKDETVTVQFDEDVKITMELPAWGPVSEALAETLTEMCNPKNTQVYAPNRLLSQLRTVCRQFIGYNQHDSHELLRQLLDTVKVEDTKRYQAKLLKHAGYTTKTNPADMSEEKKAHLKSLVMKLPDLCNIRPDNIFKGKLVSTVCCVVCSHKSEVVESFLDLSLPIQFEKFQACFVKQKFKADEATENKSKHQLKKEKKAALKLHRKNNRKFNEGSKLHFQNSPVNEKNMRLSTDEDAKPKHLIAAEMAMNVDEDENVMNGAGEALSAQNDESDGDDANEVGSDADSEDSSSEVEDESRNDGEGEAEEGELSGEEGEEGEVTLQPALVTDLSENTLLACLSQFTTAEQLNEHNKVYCESCTKRMHPQTTDNNAKKKMVYQISTKRLLICRPPPVLILHLKRFQAAAFTFKKITTPVEYPLILDIGPFCAKSCEGVRPGQKKVIYSLYGIVEHSGSLHGGHYVSYVKTRPSVKSDSYRRSFLQSYANDAAIKQLENENGIENVGGSWYYISDSHVRAISENEVTQKQAYLLFYERIL